MEDEGRKEQSLARLQKSVMTLPDYQVRRINVETRRRNRTPEGLGRSIIAAWQHAILMHLPLLRNKKGEMKIAIGLILFLTLISDMTFGQLKCSFNIISEIETGEEMFFVEEVFGDGEKRQYRNRIISKAQEDDKLKLFIGVKSMEKGKLFCEVEMSNDTLRLEFRVRGKVIDERGELVEIGPSKYREVEIQVDNLKVEPKVILLNGEEIRESQEMFLTFPVQFDVVEGDTINRKDAYGQRQGRWIKKDVNSITESYYKDSKLTEAKWTDYYVSGKIKFEYFYNPAFKVGDVCFRSYFESGGIQKEDYKIINSGLFKRMWDQDGLLIQENFYTGQQIEIIQYKERGKIDCKCETKVGVESFNGVAVSWQTNEFEIPCIFYDENGEEIGRRKKKFKLNYEIKPRW